MKINIKNFIKQPIHLITISVILVIIVVLILPYTRRYIIISTLYFLYDCISLFGLRWQITPEYCSTMKFGFTPVMPLEFYTEFNKAIFPRISSGNNTINQEEVIKICDRNLSWLKKNGTIATAKQIDIIYINDPDLKKKCLHYVKNNYPFVIRGLELDCFTNMKLGNLMKRAENDKVYMSPSGEKCKDNIFTELKNIYENKCYITNSTNLFIKYPELLPDKDMDKIQQILNNYMKNDSKQLFLGIERGQGTALHAAYTNNFYIMIEGQKKWSFFNPNQIALLYPNFQKSGIYMASECRFLNFDTDTHLDKFPLIKYADRYEVILEEKDILYNPQSWFHAVYNLTDTSVASSTRWSVPGSIPETNMLRYGNLTNPNLRDYVRDIYTSSGILGISHIDEHKHMIGEKDPDAVPFWDKHTNNNHKLCLDEDCSNHWHIL